MVADFDAEKGALELLMQVRHSHIIQLLMTYTHEGAYNLIFSWADIDLRTYLSTSSNPCSQAERLPIWRQLKNVASAIHSIHELAIQVDDASLSHIGHHHDLKPQNILVMKGNFMVADLGLARFRSASCTSKTSLKWGTNLYAPPQKPYTSQRRLLGNMYASKSSLDSQLLIFCMPINSMAAKCLPVHANMYPAARPAILLCDRLFAQNNFSWPCGDFASWRACMRNLAFWCMLGTLLGVWMRLPSG